MAKSPDDMMSAVIGSLADRTGRPPVRSGRGGGAGPGRPRAAVDRPAGVRAPAAVQRPGQATHKIALRSVADVDDEVLHLVRLAYDQNG